MLSTFGSIASLVYLVIDIGYIITLSNHCFEPTGVTAASLVAFDIALLLTNLLAHSQMKLDQDVCISLVTLTITTASNLSLCAVALYNGHYMSDAERVTVVVSAGATCIALLITAWLVKTNGEDSAPINRENVVNASKDTPGTSCGLCKQRKAIVVSLNCGHRFVCATCCNEYNREGDSMACTQCGQVVGDTVALDDKELTLICSNYVIENVAV